MIQEAWVVVPILLLFWALVSLCKTSVTAAAAAKSLQLCPTLSDPIDGSPPGSAVHGIFQARVLEWVAIAFSVSYLKKGKMHPVNLEFRNFSERDREDGRNKQ